MAYDLSVIGRYSIKYRRVLTSIYVDIVDSLDNSIKDTTEFSNAGVSGPVPTEVVDFAQGRLSTFITGPSLGGGSSTGLTSGRTRTAASTTLNLADANTLLTSNHASVAQVYTIPNDATIAWPVLTYIAIYQQGAAAASFTNGAGVGTIQGTPPTAGAGVISGVLKVSANTWAYN